MAETDTGKETAIARAFPLFLLIAAFWLYFPLLEFFQLGMEDEGELLYFSHRVLEGQFPNRDFFTRLPPLSFGSVALVWKVFGESLEGARVLLIFTAACSSILLYLLALRVLPFGLAALASLLYLTEFTHWPGWSQNWSNAPVFLFTCWLLVRHLEKPTRFSMLWVGLSIGLCALNTQYAGFTAAVLAAIVALTESTFKARLSGLGWQIVGAGGVLLLYLVIYGMAGALPGLWNDQIVFPFAHYAGFNKTYYQLFPNWDQFKAGVEVLESWTPEQRWMARRQILGLFTWPLVTLLSHTLYYPVIALGFGVAFREWWRSGERITCVLAVGQLGLAFPTFLRPDAARIASNRSLWWIILFILLWKLLRDRQRWQVGLVASPLVLLFFAVLIQAGLKRSQWAGADYWVPFPRGAIKVRHPQLAGALNQMNQELNRRSDRGDKIFIYPWNSLLYILTARDNPARCDRLLPMYTSEEIYAEVFRALEQEPELKAVLIFPLDFDLYLKQYPTVPRKEFEELYRHYEEQLRTRFPERIMEVRF